MLFNESRVGIKKECSTDSGKRSVQFDDVNEKEEMNKPAETEPEPAETEPAETEPAETEPAETEPAETEPAVRRSGRQSRPPTFYGEWASIASKTEPATVTEALNGPDKSKWTNAMEREMNSLSKNDVWDLVELPKDRKPVGSKWVFKVKFDADRSVERYKARLVAQGYSQKPGLDYDKTFSPVVRFESLRTVIALALQNDLKLHQMDVTTAFLNGELEEDVYMCQPEGFVAPGREKLVCKLKRSIYGLKQSPRCWNSILDSHLKGMGFVQTSSDPCLYVNTEGEFFVIAVYVDDIVLAGRDEKRLSQVKEAIGSKFEVKDMGALHYFLGVRIIQDQTNGKNWIGQQAYTEGLLQRFGMENAKPVSTPVDVGTKLVKAIEETDLVDQRLYQSAVGSLLYLSTGTRPDITFAVSNVAKFCAEPSNAHWTAVKRIFRYLKGTSNLGLLYRKNSPGRCTGYSDSDWAGDIEDRRSTSGYVFLINGADVSWRSKKQSCVALSTAEAALASAAQEAMWIRQLTQDLKDGSDRATVIYEDNQAVISMAQNPHFHGRAKVPFCASAGSKRNSGT